MGYTLQQAKANLSKLIKEAESGKEVVITRGKKPVVKLVAIASAGKQPSPDMLKGLIWFGAGCV